MSVVIVKWSLRSPSPIVEMFLERSAFDQEAEKVAADVLAEVRKLGNTAVLAAAKKFDGVALKASEIRVSKTELTAAAKESSALVQDAVRDAHARVKRYSQASMRDNWQMETASKGYIGECFSPMDRVGVYVPGGTAPLASTAVMTVTLAKCAGVKEIVVCTPCGKDKQVNPALLYALKIAGATEIYKIGGIQAIGMMAFGTQSVGSVEKIVGPGNAYVTAAKRQVYGFVAIDQVAGPSEIAILADDSANPAWVAADLLSQAEHGSGHEKSFLVTTSLKLAEAVRAELLEQLQTLSRAEMIQKVINANGILFAVVPSLKQGMGLINRFAPEHLEIMTRNARSMVNLVRCAGAIFVGEWTPEAAGDFVAGPSHVLPTGGTARMFNGLTVDDFRRRHSFVEYTKEDLAEARTTIEAFAAMEGLDAHGRSASIRFDR